MSVESKKGSLTRSNPPCVPRTQPTKCLWRRQSVAVQVDRGRLAAEQARRTAKYAFFVGQSETEELTEVCKSWLVTKRPGHLKREIFF